MRNFWAKYYVLRRYLGNWSASRRARDPRSALQERRQHHGRDHHSKDDTSPWPSKRHPLQQVFSCLIYRFCRFIPEKCQLLKAIADGIKSKRNYSGSTFDQTFADCMFENPQEGKTHFRTRTLRRRTRIPKLLETVSLPGPGSETSS